MHDIMTSKSQLLKNIHSLSPESRSYKLIQLIVYNDSCSGFINFKVEKNTLICNDQRLCLQKRKGFTIDQ